MTCCIRHNDNPGCKVVETAWVIADYLPAIDNRHVIELLVDGVELQHITQLLGHLIRPPKHDSVLWEGDLARIIWGLIRK